MRGLFLDVIVTPWERFIWGYGWIIPAALVVIVAAIVAAILIRRRKKK